MLLQVMADVSGISKLFYGSDKIQCLYRVILWGFMWLFYEKTDFNAVSLYKETLGYQVS